ncbi:DUF2947 family protein [Sulfidibacter corallicola]|uniref:DUF2947 family protein n=1 Tax=Sulfidibacter corallicola TaxID=2818388 RepID=A0A8A4TJZ0_SULCO|nr:DUF2947 family protein [Sulfidibacter corallicola]QTD49462.1 DUF2947 family protein [Sulfidibacter corallicola]
MKKEIPGVFYNDPEMSEADLDGIDVLEEGECSNLWQEYVSEKNRHFMLLADDEWPAKVVGPAEPWYIWEDEWNRGKYDNFKSALFTLGINGESTLYVFWGKETGVKTNWRIFTNNWANFLYEDEGCILIVLDSKTAVILSNGRAWKGDRGSIQK